MSDGEHSTVNISVIATGRLSVRRLLLLVSPFVLAFSKSWKPALGEVRRFDKAFAARLVVRIPRAAHPGQIPCAPGPPRIRRGHIAGRDLSGAPNPVAAVSAQWPAPVP